MRTLSVGTEVGSATGRGGVSEANEYIPLSANLRRGFGWRAKTFFIRRHLYEKTIEKGSHDICDVPRSRTHDWVRS